MTNKKGSMADDIIGAIREGTKKWTKTIKSEERSPSTRSYRRVRVTAERGTSFKEAAEEIMRAAYNQASGNGVYPANARQIMYAARPFIQKATGKPLKSEYFTQVLLPDYLNEYSHITDNWNVVYDARGHFSEPHTDKVFGVGTLAVRNYLDNLHEPKQHDAELNRAKIKTLGPSGDFGAVLFIEKEGFDELMSSAQIAKRYDLAIISTKGMSVTAARLLVDEMCAEYGVPLLLMHDMDKAGRSIAGTLQRDTRRYEFQNEIEVIDLGLSLPDVEAMGLEFEHQFHAKGDKRKLRANLRDNGASEAEIDFMFADFDETRSTRRVELNAMTAPQFIEFLERKLQEHGIEKVVPDHDDLEKAYKFFVRNLDIEKMIENEIKNHKFDADAIKVPDNLTEQVEKVLSEHPRLRWDRAVYKIAGGNLMVEAEPEKPKPGPAAPKPKPAAMSSIVKVLGEVFHAPPEVAAAWATLTKADLRREMEAYKRAR